MYIEKDVVKDGVIIGLGEYLDDHGLALDLEQERTLVDYITEGVYTRLTEDEEYTTTEPERDIDSLSREDML